MQTFLVRLLGAPRVSRAALVMTTCLCAIPIASAAQDYWVVHNFNRNDGAQPQAELTPSGSTLIGTTYDGNIFRNGVVFSVSADGSNYKQLRNFNGSDGARPNGGLLLADSVLYGTTSCGGSSNNGVLFRLNLDGSGFALLKDFAGGADGRTPVPRLQVSGSTLFGAASLGGTSNCGTLFKLSTNGSSFIVLKNFTGSDGLEPRSVVLSGTNVYGATERGGSTNAGTLFVINTDGSGFRVLRSFAWSDGANPSGNLLLSASTLYGVTSFGGPYDGGTVFQLNTDGNGFMILHSFFTTNSDGYRPCGGLVLAGATLYGTTLYGGNSNRGTVFQVNTDGGGYGVLKHFNSPDGTYPYAGLALAGGALYGTTSAGGSTDSGVVYGLTLPAVAPTVVVPPLDQAVPAGGTVTLAVRAAGLQPLSYQWYLNGHLSFGSTSSALQLVDVQSSQAGPYTVVVTNTFGAVTSPPALLTVIPPGDKTVNSCSEAALRAAMAAGGKVSLVCDGTITLGATITVATNTVLDGTGHEVTISGAQAVQVFAVSSNASLTLVNLAVADGANVSGGGFLNDGTLTMLGVTLSNSVVRNPWQVGGSASGGGVLNRYGTLNATNCVFSRNHAGSAYSYNLNGPAFGGAIYNIGGQLNLNNCLFTDNAADDLDLSYDGASGGNSAGGAIYNSGTLRAALCTFSRNSASGGAGADGGPGNWPSAAPGGAGGSARGGAFCNLGNLSISCSLFASNSAVGGAGGNGGSGYSPLPGQGYCGGAGGQGGSGFGGAVYNEGQATLANCTLAWNVGTGGSGGYVGFGQPCHPGGSGGVGAGAIGASSGQLSLLNCTIAFCSGTGGMGGGSTFPPTNGAAAGGILSAGTRMVNVLLATNTLGGNCNGWFVDAGHNLSSDATCGFTNATSRNNTDPKLGPLAYNGGALWSMAQLAGSPAIDAGDSTLAPPTDARGFPRPAGAAADIGAYEYCYPAMLRASLPMGGGLDIRVFATSGQTCRLMWSTTFANWLPVATNQVGLDGTILFHYNTLPGDSPRFFRAAVQ